jgi:SanA protein
MFLVSGDRTGEQNYDETRDIKNDLIAFGVPEEKIVLDTSGLRTHDSMVALRHLCSKVHTRHAVLVSQAFQNRRALFMAPFFGIMAQGYSAKGSPTWAMSLREFLGKPKVLIDLFITNQQPKETNAIEFRDRFEITSQDHLMVLICMFLAYLFFIVYMTKYLEKYEVVSMV